MGNAHVDKVQRLITAIGRGYTHKSLERMVRTELRARLYATYSSPNLPLEDIAFDLIQKLDLQNRFADLLRAIINNRTKKDSSAGENDPPTNEKDPLVAECRYLLAVSDAPEPATDTDGPAAPLQRFAFETPLVPTFGWCAEALRMAHRVCRVEVGGAARATGFLIGPATVLTAYHTFRGVGAERPAANIRCRFDMLGSPDSPDGTPVEMADEWLLAHSPMPPRDQHPSHEDGLDFAVLGLAKPVGRWRPPGATAERGWVDVSGPIQPEPQSFLTVLQHALGGILRMSVMPAAVLAHDDAVLQYRDMTLPGSSGGPCFNDRWEVVALHHARWPSGEGGTLVCLGILITAVREALRRADRLAVLGP